MDSLFPVDAISDLGPLGLAPEQPAPPLTRIQGNRPAQLRKEVGLLAPRRPGVYAMIDAGGAVHYVGKAKNLRTRLLSYFRSRGRPAKAARLLRQTRTIVWEVWAREFSALLRELELIRRWRPRFNVVGQPAPRRHGFVCLGRPPAPYLFTTREAPANALAAFGPLPLSQRTLQAVRLLNDAFGLRDCPQPMDMVFAEEAELFAADRSAGCLRRDLGTCLAPCAGACSRTEYFAQTRRARSFLEGSDPKLVNRLRKEMTAAAALQHFERAARLRDTLDAIQWLDTRLERLRQTRAQLSLVYPVEGPSGGAWWHLLHAGRPLRAVPAPRTPADAAALLDVLESIYQRNDHPRLVDSYEHLDGMLLVSAWFRKFPSERARALTPDAAIRHCRSLIDGTRLPASHR